VRLLARLSPTEKQDDEDGDAAEATAGYDGGDGDDTCAAKATNQCGYSTGAIVLVGFAGVVIVLGVV
jgi:hypothetical protein